MEIHRSLSALCVRALTESMDVRTMTHLIKRLIPGFDIYERSGFPESLSIPNRDAAQFIVSDVIREGLFLEFVAMLIEVQEDGIMGRNYQVSYLRGIVRGVFDMGYMFDQETAMFIEDPRYRKTRNWGALQKGTFYTFAFLHADIVGNTALVREHPKQVIEQTYADLRAIVQKVVEKRNGRIWAWEGDGGLAAFYFAGKHTKAAFSAIEIIHELFFYNRLNCKLNEQLRLRLAVHSGECEYTDRDDDLIKSEPIRQLIDIEKGHTKPDSVTISPVVRNMLDSLLATAFKPIEEASHYTYYTYAVVWEA
jgi:hypothetical protein